MNKIPLYKWPPTYIFSWWAICILFFVCVLVSGCDCGSCEPLYKEGEIVTHALTGERLLVLDYRPPDPAYRCRLENGTDAWLYEGELRDSDGNMREREVTPEKSKRKRR